MEQIERNCTWIVVNNKVYDIGSYLKRNLHPGGNEIITKYTGGDVTKEFLRLHSTDAQYELEAYFIGRLKKNNKFFNFISTIWCIVL